MCSLCKVTARYLIGNGGGICRKDEHYSENKQIKKVFSFKNKQLNEYNTQVLERMLIFYRL